MTKNDSKDIKSGSMQTTIHFIFHGKIISNLQKNSCKLQVKVEECNEPSYEAQIFPYGVVLFNIFSTICI